MKIDPIHKKRDADLMFTKDHIPNLNYFNEYVANLGPGDLTGEDLHKVVVTFCDLAQRGSSTWKPKLYRDFNIDNYTLHHAAIPLLSGHPGKFWPVGLEMMATASSLAYQPSTLSLVRLFQQLGRPKDKNQHLTKIISSVEAQFKQLAQTVKDPDVLTVQGLLAQRDKKEELAHRFFTDAIALGEKNAGNPTPNEISVMEAVVGPNSSLKNPLLRPPRWHYERVCRQQEGLIWLKKGQEDLAYRSFLIGLAELDLPDASFELAKMNKPGTPYYREFMLMQAAQRGHKEACRLLVKDYLTELNETEELTTSKGRKDTSYIKWIWGWMLVAGRDPGDQVLTDELRMVHQAVRKGRVSMRLERIRDDGALQVATWIHNRQQEPVKIEFNI